MEEADLRDVPVRTIRKNCNKNKSRLYNLLHEEAHKRKSLKRLFAKDVRLLFQWQQRGDLKAQKGRTRNEETQV